MDRFSQLYEALDAATRADAKVEAMAAYFRTAPPEDAAWAVFLLTGQRLRRLVPGRALRAWALRATGLPEWLVSEAEAAVGDAVETVTLLLAGQAAGPSLPLHRWLEERILPLQSQPAEHQYDLVAGWWRELPRAGLLLLNKILTGGFRAGVSRLLVVRALALASGLPRATLSHRLAGPWRPSAASYRALIAAPVAGEDRSRPFPFLLASALQQAPDSLGPPERWLAEWKWDGIRAQLIRRGGEIFLWSRAEELITECFPELIEAAARLPDGVVLDGEVLAWGADGVRPRAVLQQRIGRQRPTARLLEQAPVVFAAFDLLEVGGVDVRDRPLAERRARLEAVLEDRSRRLQASPVLDGSSWAELEALRAECRARGVEGLMLKGRDSVYGQGRERGAWWAWAVPPLTVEAVLVYAQAGSGRHADLFADYTFAVWRGADLVPIAKARSGLSEPEILSLDRWIRRHTIDRFGPVRQVAPAQVFELAFEAVSPSPRHKSGVALRRPRVVRWLTDRPAGEADRLGRLEMLLPA